MLKKILAVSIALSVSSPALAIMGGEIENWNDHQAAVDTLGCSGSLIAPDIVLTAAHCGESEYVKLHDGSYEKVKEFIDHPHYEEVQKVISENGVLDTTHPDYDRLTQRNADIRIVKLESKVKTNEVFKLPTAKIAHNEQVTLWGFGLNDSILDGSGVNEDLFKSALGRVFDYTTSDSIENFDDVFRVDPIKGSGCFGDSGGSFTDSNGTVHGVIVMTEAVDFKDCDATKNADGLYVYDYVNWIYDSIEKMSSSESEGILSYPSNVTAGQTIRVQNIGQKDAYIYGSGEPVADGKLACSGVLASGEECYLTLPEGNTEYTLSPNDIVAYNYTGNAGTVSEKEYNDIVYGGAGENIADGNTGSNTSTGGGSGGSTGLLSLLGLGLIGLRRKK